MGQKQIDALLEIRQKVNGKFLSNFNGKAVSILGYVIKVHPNGSSFEMRTTDKQEVTVILSDPLNEPLEGWVEVRGMGQGKCHITAQHLLPLPTDVMTKFDADLYDDLINVINSNDNPFSSS